jgi:hypothetical protein
VRAEELVALASAHGVDLTHNARLGTPGRRHATERQRGTNGHSYEVLTAPSAQRANGRASYTHARPAWSIEDLGQAAAGVPRLSFLAACYSYAGDRSAYWELWAGLERAAQELRLRHAWPAQVRSAAGPHVFYLEQLACLVLDEDAHPHLFQSAPGLYAIYAGVDESTWRQSVFHRFDKVRLRFLGWIGEAMSIMQARLED